MAWWQVTHLASLQALCCLLHCLAQVCKRNTRLSFPLFYGSSVGKVYLFYSHLPCDACNYFKEVFLQKGRAVHSSSACTDGDVSCSPPHGPHKPDCDTSVLAKAISRGKRKKWRKTEENRKLFFFLWTPEPKNNFEQWLFLITIYWINCFINNHLMHLARKWMKRYHLHVFP